MAGHRMDTLNTNARAVLRRETIGIVFQSFNLIPSLTVRENVALPQRLAGQTRKSADARTSELLKGLGLHDFQNAAVTTLSGGQQQRVAMARAVANRPAVLLADEPTGSLDTEASANVIGLLKQEHQRGQTIVMVTHDYSVASAADRIVRLRDGLVVDDEHIEPHPADLYIDELVGRTTPSAFERLVSFE